MFSGPHLLYIPFRLDQYRNEGTKRIFPTHRYKHDGKRSYSQIDTSFPAVGSCRTSFPIRIRNLFMNITTMEPPSEAIIGVQSRANEQRERKIVKYKHLRTKTIIGFRWTLGLGLVKHTAGKPISIGLCQ